MKKIIFEKSKYLDKINITPYIIYEVSNYTIKPNGDKYFDIIDNLGYIQTIYEYGIYSAQKSVFIFKDVTKEYRNEVINEILL